MTVIDIKQGKVFSSGGSTRAAARVQPVAQGQHSSRWDLAGIDLQSPEQWVNAVVADKPHEKLTTMFFEQFPNLKFATQRLAAYITPYWPAHDGTSLLDKTIARAVNALVAEISQGDKSNGRLIGLYLYHLTASVEDIALVRVVGKTSSGMNMVWPYLSAPIMEWAHENGIKTAQATLNDNRLTATQIEGLRTCLLGRIVNTTDDAGYMSSYAPRG